MNVIVQPDAGLDPVLRAIRGARRTIEIAIFRIDRKDVERALGAAVGRGVRVRVLVAHTNRGGEARLRKVEQRLLDAGATVARTGDDFVRYHGKYLVADDRLHLYAFNLTAADLASRSFGISTRDARAVRQARAVFEADTTRQPYTPGRSPLVVSPETARAALTTFIAAARRQLLVYDMSVQDKALIRLLVARMKAGCDVRIIGRIKGTHAIPCLPLRGQRLHARAIVRDATHAFVGSQSLRRLELDARREVGLIITNRAAAQRLRDVFERDWSASADAPTSVEVVAPAPLDTRTAPVVAT